MMRLSDEYWDCECEADYIHPNTHGRCPWCGALRDESPDSRRDEVEAGTHIYRGRESGDPAGPSLQE